MKKIFLAVFFSFPVVLCFGQTDCRVFKTGVYSYRDSADNLITVTRKKKRQQEYDAKNNIITKLRVKWTNDCEYQLTQIWSNSKNKKKQNGTVSRVVITKTYGNARYDYNCGCKDLTIKGRNGTMTRIKE